MEKFNKDTHVVTAEDAKMMFETPEQRRMRENTEVMQQYKERQAQKEELERVAVNSNQFLGHKVELTEEQIEEARQRKRNVGSAIISLTLPTTARQYPPRDKRITGSRRVGY